MGEKPKKGLGQHFLRDRDISEAIVSASGFGRFDSVLEIGPGHGALTFILAPRVNHLVAVEKDAELAERLRSRIFRSGIGNVNIVTGDIMDWDFSLMRPERGVFHVVGNLPYYISKPILERLLEYRTLIGRAVIMVQKEVAQRLTAEPGGKDYGALSLLVRYHAEAKILMFVGRNAFFPRPNVDSAVIELDFGRPFQSGGSIDERFLFSIIKASFAMRRKTITNSLSVSFPFIGKARVASALEKAGVSPGARAETLTMDDFMRLSSIMQLTMEEYNRKNTA